MSPPCLLNAWSAHEPELRGYLRHRLDDTEDADDLLQEVFLKALRQGQRFCAVENARAWLFQVTRNALTDRRRSSREHLPAAGGPARPGRRDSVPHRRTEPVPAAATGRAVRGGPPGAYPVRYPGPAQQVLADRLGLSLPGAKSRLQRARVRLRQRLVEACQVRFDEAGTVCCFNPGPPLT